MRRLILFYLSFLSGCVASSVSPNLDRQLTAKAQELVSQGDFAISTDLQQLGRPFTGANCFEPMLYVLSLGIIPAHCKDSYLLKVTITSGSNSKAFEQPFEVTTMQGWLMLFLPISPNWQFGEFKNASERAKNTVINREAAGL